MKLSIKSNTIMNVIKRKEIPEFHVLGKLIFQLKANSPNTDQLRKYPNSRENLNIFFLLQNQ